MRHVGFLEGGNAQSEIERGVDSECNIRGKQNKASSSTLWRLTRVRDKGIHQVSGLKKTCFMK